MARRRRRTAEPPEVRPLDVDGVRTVAVGTVLWAIAFIVLALRRSSLEEQGRGWWLWACLAGVGLGLLGLEYTRKRRDAIAQALLDDEAARSDDDAHEPKALDAPDALVERDSTIEAELREPDSEPLDETRIDPQFEPIDSGPPVPAPMPTGRRARRATRSPAEPAPAIQLPSADDEQNAIPPPSDDGKAIPQASDDPESSGEGPPLRHRDRRHASPEEHEPSTDGGRTYRGRRARRRRT